MMGYLTTHRVSNTAFALVVVYWQHVAYPRLPVRCVSEDHNDIMYRIVGRHWYVLRAGYLFRLVLP